MYGLFIVCRSEIRLKQYINKTKILNTCKIGLAAILAILLAQVLQLTFAVSAGIVAILSVAPTKKETIGTAIGRFFAFLVALVIAFGCFELIGYGTEAFFLYLILFIFVCQCFGWNHAMAMDSVLISHFLSFQTMNVKTVGNEVLIFIIGVGFGILANLHLHKNTDYVEQMKTETDQQIKLALHRMSERILNQNLADYDGSCFVKMEASLQRAKNIARENFMNQFGSSDRWDIEYIAMRERQIHVLSNMYQCVSTLHTRPITAKRISDFLEKMSCTYHRDNSVEELLEDFYQIDEEMKKSPLPVKREEFEDRAQLYTLMRQIEEFLLIKNEFAKKCSGK